MAKMGKFDLGGMKQLQKELNKLAGENTEAFVEECAKELAARLLAKVIRRTPVGDYSKEVVVTAKRDGKKHRKGEQYTKRINPSGKVGGTLRRGWISESQAKAESGKGRPSKEEIEAFADSVKINHFGDMYVIEIVNMVWYASFVEYGHRTPNHKGWVKGKFMMTISEREIQQIAPKVLEKKIMKFLGECMQ